MIHGLAHFIIKQKMYPIMYYTRTLYIVLQDRSNSWSDFLLSTATW